MSEYESIIREYTRACHNTRASCDSIREHVTIREHLLQMINVLLHVSDILPTAPCLSSSSKLPVRCIRVHINDSLMKTMHFNQDISNTRWRNHYNHLNHEFPNYCELINSLIQITWFSIISYWLSWKKWFGWCLRKALIGNPAALCSHCSVFLRILLRKALIWISAAPFAFHTDGHPQTRRHGTAAMHNVSTS